MRKHPGYLLMAALGLVACGSSKHSSSGTAGDSGSTGGTGGASMGGSGGAGGGTDGGSTGGSNQTGTAAAGGNASGGQTGSGGGAGTSSGGAGMSGGRGGTVGRGGSGGSGGGSGGSGGGAGTSASRGGSVGTGGAAGMDPGTAGLAAYWRFDEGSGTTVADSSGHGNALSRTGPTGPEWVTGKSGSAVHGLSGTSTLSAGDVLNSVTLPLSISVWLRFDSQVAPNGGQVVIESETGSTRRGFSLQTTPAGDNYWFRYFDDTGAMEQLLAGGAPAVGRWTHVAVVASATSIVLYVDGQAKAGTPTGTATLLASATGTVTVASSSDATVTWSVDELRLYSRALSAGEVASLASQ